MAQVTEKITEDVANAFGRDLDKDVCPIVIDTISKLSIELLVKLCGSATEACRFMDKISNLCGDWDFVDVNLEPTELW